MNVVISRPLLHPGEIQRSAGFFWEGLNQRAGWGDVPARAFRTLKKSSKRPSIHARQMTTPSFFREIVKVGSPTILAHFLYRCEKNRGAGRDPQR
jgi:hypothetical protein